MPKMDKLIFKPVTGSLTGAFAGKHKVTQKQVFKLPNPL